MRLRMFLLLITFLKTSHSFRNRLLVICTLAYLFATFFMISLSSPLSSFFPYTTLFRSSNSSSPPQSRSCGIDRTDARSQLELRRRRDTDRKSTRLNSSHRTTSYAVFCLKKKNRYATSYVSPAYHLLEDFPFIQEPPSGDLHARVLIRHFFYDQSFQSVIFILSLHDALPI